MERCGGSTGGQVVAVVGREVKLSNVKSQSKKTRERLHHSDTHKCSVRKKRKQTNGKIHCAKMIIKNVINKYHLQTHLQKKKTTNNLYVSQLLGNKFRNRAVFFLFNLKTSVCAANVLGAGEWKVSSCHDLMTTGLDVRNEKCIRRETSCLLSSLPAHWLMLKKKKKQKTK